MSHISSTGDDRNILSTEWYFLTLTHIPSPEMTLPSIRSKMFLSSLIHISSPEMTGVEFLMERTVKDFDSHLLAGDDL